MDKINIFVNSTCYDLAQVRTDLKYFIEDLGHNPILSEEHDFPIDPNKENIENCINAVREKADIFILIIGSIMTASSNKIDNYGEYLSWTTMKFEQLSHIIDALNTVFNKMFPYYYTKLDITSDLDGLYYAAKTYGKLYASLLEWSIDALSLVVKNEYIQSRNVLAKLADEAILQTEEFPIKCLKQMENIE